MHQQLTQFMPLVLKYHQLKTGRGDLIACKFCYASVVQNKIFMNCRGGKTFFNDFLEEIQFVKQRSKLIFERCELQGVWNKEKQSLLHWKSSLGTAYSEDTAVHYLSMSGLIVLLADGLWLLKEGRNYIHLILISNIRPVVYNLKFSSTVLHCPMLWSDANDQLFLRGLFAEIEFILC